MIQDAKHRLLKTEVERELKRYQTWNDQAELVPPADALGMLIYRLEKNGLVRYIPFTRSSRTAYPTISRAIQHALYTYADMETDTSQVKELIEKYLPPIDPMAKMEEGREVRMMHPPTCARCDHPLHFWPMLFEFPELVGCYRCDNLLEVDGYRRTILQMAYDFNRLYQGEQKVTGSLKDCFEHPAQLYNASFGVRLPPSVYFEMPAEQPTTRIAWSSKGLLYKVDLLTPRYAMGFHDYQKWENIETLEQISNALEIDPATTMGCYWMTQAQEEVPALETEKHYALPPVFDTKTFEGKSLDRQLAYLKELDTSNGNGQDHP